MQFVCMCMCVFVGGGRERETFSVYSYFHFSFFIIINYSNRMNPRWKLKVVSSLALEQFEAGEPKLVPLAFFALALYDSNRSTASLLIEFPLFYVKFTFIGIDHQKKKRRKNFTFPLFGHKVEFFNFLFLGNFYSTKYLLRAKKSVKLSLLLLSVLSSGLVLLESPKFTYSSQLLKNFYPVTQGNPKFFLFATLALCPSLSLLLIFSPGLKDHYISLSRTASIIVLSLVMRAFFQSPMWGEPYCDVHLNPPCSLTI